MAHLTSKTTQHQYHKSLFYFPIHLTLLILPNYSQKVHDHSNEEAQIYQQVLRKTLYDYLPVNHVSDLEYYH